MQSADRMNGSGPVYEEIRDRETFDAFYAIYLQLFPLPDEREPPEAFSEITTLNNRADVQERFGPWREIVSTIRLSAGGPIVGGHVFGVTTSPAHLSFGCRASVQGIYTFLKREARGRGGLHDAKSYMTKIALETYGLQAEGGRIPPLIFFEVNNPLRMTPDEIAKDTESSGVNPCLRYQFWKRNGFAPLDFCYVQPRLRPSVEPVRYLDLFCSTEAGSDIPAELILAHLKPFVSISILKGHDAFDDPDFRTMADILKPGRRIPFIDSSSAEQREIAARAITTKS